MFIRKLFMLNFSIVRRYPVTLILNKQYFSNLVFKSNRPLLFNVDSVHIIERNYAKSKDKKSNKGKKKVEINFNQLGEVLDIGSYEEQLQRSINTLKKEYVKNLSLRSTTGAIETLNVKLDGKDYNLQELAQIVRTNPKTIVLNMAVFPQAITAVIQTIQKSGMNLNPQQDGTTIYIPVPKVTKDYREGLAKNAKVLFVKCKDTIRDIQNKNLRDIKKLENISKDDSFNVQSQIGAIADKYVKEAETIFSTKQSELLGKE